MNPKFTRNKLVIYALLGIVFGLASIVEFQPAKASATLTAPTANRASYNAMGPVSDQTVYFLAAESPIWVPDGEATAESPILVGNGEAIAESPIYVGNGYLTA